MGRTSDQRLEVPVRLPVILKASGMFQYGPSVPLNVEIPATKSEMHLMPFGVRVLDFNPPFDLFHSLHEEAW